MRRKPVKGYADHATPDGIAHREVILHGVIENRRDKTPARDTICVLRSIEVLEGECNIEDSSPLKWARHNRQYSQTILPGDSRKVDLLAYRPDPTGSDPGIFLHSQQDFKPRKPLITAEGTYRLAYEVYAREFPPLRFSVTLDYRDDSVHVQGPPATGIEVWPPTVDVSRTEQAQAAYEHHLPAESEERD